MRQPETRKLRLQPLIFRQGECDDIFNFNQWKKLFVYHLIANMACFCLICFWFNSFASKDDFYVSVISYVPILLAFLPYLCSGYVVAAVMAMWVATVWFVWFLTLAGNVNHFITLIYWFMGPLFLLSGVIMVCLFTSKLRLFHTENKMKNAALSAIATLLLPVLLFFVYGLIKEMSL